MLIDNEPARCHWCGSDPGLRHYHDREWGVPCTDDRELFEFLVLEGAQAGLSWLTILRKREGYREVFEGFDVERLARWSRPEIEEALDTTAIVRNRRKVESVVGNARATIALQQQGYSLAHWFWRFVDGVPLQNRWREPGAVPASTALSARISGELRRQGFSFVGPTIIYAFMQAVGMVNDHLVDCFRHSACAALAPALEGSGGTRDAERLDTAKENT